MEDLVEVVVGRLEVEAELPGLGLVKLVTGLVGGQGSDVPSIHPQIYSITQLLDLAWNPGP